MKGLKPCFTSDTVNQILAIQLDLSHDEVFSATRGRGHRLRRDLKRQDDHVVLSMDDYKLIFCTCLRTRLTIKFMHDVQPKLSFLQPTKHNEWSFSADALKSAAHDIAWPVHERIGLLTFGGHNYSSDTPPVSFVAWHCASCDKQCP